MPQPKSSLPLTFLATTLLGLATGCSSVEVTGRDLYSTLPPSNGDVSDEIHYSRAVARDPATSESIRSALARRDLVQGMSMTDVREVWGEPGEVETAGSPTYGNQRWIYYTGLSSQNGLGSARSVYFEAGRVIGWQSEQ
mgnify:CR=1 FL=1